MPLAADAVLIFAANAQLGIGLGMRLHRELVFHERFHGPALRYQPPSIREEVPVK